ncbi:hypothetical protein [Shewanella sp. UCD-KL12]|nr:hypothetical protein [Shewanella sp. UCD-KL12]
MMAIKLCYRYIIVINREIALWVWLHRHASSAAVSQEDGAAYPTGR